QLRLELSGLLDLRVESLDFIRGTLRRHVASLARLVRRALSSAQHGKLLLDRLAFSEQLGAPPFSRSQLIVDGSKFALERFHIPRETGRARPQLGPLAVELASPLDGRVTRRGRRGDLGLDSCAQRLSRHAFGFNAPGRRLDRRDLRAQSSNPLAES